jgi:hypothetical protein
MCNYHKNYNNDIKMKSYPPAFVLKIYQLPVFGDLFICVGYLFSLFSPLGLWLLGYKRLKYGISVIWAPKNKRSLILDGVECLRSHDEEMFLRFTTKQKLFIYYSGSDNITNLLGYIFGLQEKYIRFGKEGVACFIVQSLFVSEASPSINQFKLKHLRGAALKAVPRKTMEWMQQHSFDSRLIISYSKVVEKWEQNNSP